MFYVMESQQIINGFNISVNYTNSILSITVVDIETLEMYTIKSQEEFYKKFKPVDKFYNLLLHAINKQDGFNIVIEEENNNSVLCTVTFSNQCINITKKFHLYKVQEGLTNKIKMLELENQRLKKENEDIKKENINIKKDFYKDLGTFYQQMLIKYIKFEEDNDVCNNKDEETVYEDELVCEDEESVYEDDESVYEDDESVYEDEESVCECDITLNTDTTENRVYNCNCDCDYEKSNCSETIIENNNNVYELFVDKDKIQISINGNISNYSPGMFPQKIHKLYCTQTNRSDDKSTLIMLDYCLNNKCVDEIKIDFVDNNNYSNQIIKLLKKHYDYTKITIITKKPININGLENHCRKYDIRLLYNSPCVVIKL